MFCRKCGRPIEGEQTLCSSCAEEKPAQVVEETKVAPSSCDTFELNTAESVSVKKAPKKKRGLIIAVAALLVAAAATVVGIILNMDSADASDDRTLQSPEEYLIEVESAAIAEYSADLAQFYGNLLGSYSADQTASEAEIRLTLGDDLLSLVESALQQQGANMDVDWLREISLSLSSNIQDAAMQMALGVGLGKGNLLSLDMIFDMEDGKAYVTVPELNDDYLSADITSGISLNELKEILSQRTQMSNALIKALPSAEELNELINTYANIVLSGIDDVEKQEETVTINEVSQNMVVLTARIKEADLLDMAEDVLKKAEKDETLKKVITALGEYANEMGKLNSDDYVSIDLYEEFVNAIPLALESLDEEKEQADSDNYVKLNVYVDMKNQIRGHELIVYTDGERDGEPISWVTVVEDDTTYIDAGFGEVQITGEKTEKEGVSEGNYALSVDGEKIGVLKFENISETGGTLQLIPSEEIMSELLSGSGIPVAFLGENLVLELVYGTQETNKVSYEMNVLVGSKTLIGLALSSQASNEGEISIPSNALSANDQAGVLQWIKDANFDNILDRLEEANVPKDLVDVARSYVNMLQNSMN